MRRTYHWLPKSFQYRPQVCYRGLLLSGMMEIFLLKVQLCKLICWPTFMVLSRKVLWHRIFLRFWLITVAEAHLCLWCSTEVNLSWSMNNPDSKKFGRLVNVCENSLPVYLWSGPIRCFWAFHNFSSLLLLICHFFETYCHQIYIYKNQLSWWGKTLLPWYCFQLSIS